MAKPAQPARPSIPACPSASSSNWANRVEQPSYAVRPHPTPTSGPSPSGHCQAGPTGSFPLSSLFLRTGRARARTEAAPCRTGPPDLATFLRAKPEGRREDRILLLPPTAHGCAGPRSRTLRDLVCQAREREGKEMAPAKFPPPLTNPTLEPPIKPTPRAAPTLAAIWGFAPFPTAARRGLGREGRGRR